MIPLRCFSHIAIRVSDLERSLAFYRDVLGFQAVSQWVETATPSMREAGVTNAEVTALFIERDGITLELLAVRSTDGLPIPTELYKIDPGYRHFGLRVVAESTGDAEPCIDEIVRNGGAVRPNTLGTLWDGSGYVVMINDSEGNRIELLGVSGTIRPIGLPLPPVEKSSDPGLIDRLTGFVMGVEDLAEATRFYADCLGWSLEQIYEDSAQLSMGAVTLVLESIADEQSKKGITRVTYVSKDPQAAVDAMTSRGASSIEERGAEWVVCDWDGVAFSFASS